MKRLVLLTALALGVTPAGSAPKFSAVAANLFLWSDTCNVYVVRDASGNCSSNRPASVK
jgi:hypothetical protein